MNPEDVSILIVDDEYSVRDSLCSWFQADGYHVDTAADANEALKKLQNESWDIILLDIKMPGMDGIELQRHIKKIAPNIITIIITAFASVDTAIQALKDGAFDYICKPIDPDELSHLVRNAIERMRLLSENLALKERVNELFESEEIVGETPAMKKVLTMVAEVAGTDATVMIRGESGTGKELVARAIHKNSGRRYFPLISINCGAYPEGLLESELFGHEKGAFTGAQFARKGKLEMANKGTIFFDEIGDISQKMQMDLLRVLETKTFFRLGGSQEISTDFRVISATNRNLETMVKEGTFREDLYYRLNVFSIVLPPIRDRRADIPLLAHYLLKKYSMSMSKQFEDFTPAAMEKLMRHSWPGNVRELRNAIERAMVVAKSLTIDAGDFVFNIESDVPEDPPENADLRSLRDMEREHITEALERLDWNISKAAEVLGIDRVTLYNKIKKYGLRGDEDE
ncbi:MAG: sigma-54 dependent transcriptional regulator [Candidatus Lernaella stagnicola]|nr:sigma-54 dependent transcriptional regulator [Candidatus Lernaella stagnicola]